MATLTLELEPAVEGRLATLAPREGIDPATAAATILSTWAREEAEEMEELRAMLTASIEEAERDGWRTPDDVKHTLAEARAEFVALHP